jgi:hypothetical protein
LQVLLLNVLLLEGDAATVLSNTRALMPSGRFRFGLMSPM